MNPTPASLVPPAKTLATVHAGERAVRVAALLAAAAPCLSAAVPNVPLEVPEVVDSRLQVTLYADSAEIVTPIGAAVDARGRLFVLESHTHLAPPNYKGPKRDVIKVFEGAQADGRAARVSVFADDILEGMNLAFSPDGTLHVITAKTVLALPDRNGDGRADESKLLLRLETDEKYPHNQLLGLTISRDGWLYAARGNTGGHPHAWVGADGRRLEAYGNGGDIVRIRLDGSQLERFAEGFWNPFDLKFDRFGRLLCVDNDPDSRGPNRLVHLVRGGDYGFKSLYGPSGLHPYNAWDGELPGTLPMVVGIGESPSAVIDLSYAALPTEYRDALAATIWAEHTIPIYRAKRVGTTLRATTEPFIRGGRWFRPVALVTAPDGTLYITDWVLKDYPNHGFGRIWKLTAKPGVETMKPVAVFAAPEADPGLARLDEIMGTTASDPVKLRAALKDNDPFVRHAAVMALAQPGLHEVARAEMKNADADVRLGALLALRRAGIREPESFMRLALEDRDERLRLMGLIWVGEREIRSLEREVDAVASQPDITARLFETWLATKQILATPPLAAGTKPVRGFLIKRPLDPTLLERVVADEKRPAAARTFALRRLVGAKSAAHRELLLRLAKAGPPALRVEAIRTLATTVDDAVTSTLRGVAQDSRAPSRVRAEAVLALGAASPDAVRPLLADPDPEVKTQATRSLRVAPAGAAARPAPTDTSAWVKELARGGNPEAGERVFFAAASACVQCHAIDGRGGNIGPDLSVIARTANREQLVRSIIAPSEEIAPQFQGWEVKKKNGEVLTGLQGHLRTDGGASLLLFDGNEVRLRGEEVAGFRALKESLMPEGLAALFSPEELRDLVAFLETRR
jgi:putative membrane-bound dehydrogenase-like protein